MRTAEKAKCPSAETSVSSPEGLKAKAEHETDEIHITGFMTQRKYFNKRKYDRLKGQELMTVREI